MLKFTFSDARGLARPECHVNPEHIVMVQAGNPSGAIIELARSRVHVAQSVDQVLNMIADYYGEKR